MIFSSLRDTMTASERRKKLVVRWRRRIGAGFLWFILGDSIVLGFGGWARSTIRTIHIERRTSLRDAKENVPAAAFDMPSGNVSRAVFSIAPKPSSPNFITPEKLQELQDSVNIVSIIETFGLPRFQRSGEYRATCLCPFHDDNNPSMSIDGTKGIYKCFSCGAGGNVFTFVREYAKLHGNELSFYQAVKLVGDQYASGKAAFALTLPPGMDVAKRDSSTGASSPKNTLLPTATNKVKKVFRTNRKRIILANAVAASFFENCLVKRPSAGLARAHLRERGMSPRTARAFAIGYAPDSFFSRTNGPQPWGEGSLVQYLQQKGFTTTEIIDAGLATVTKKDVRKKKMEEEETPDTADVPFTSLVDRFRGRLMIPILDESGSQVLGFGGRILESSSKDISPGNYTQPKYLNSPESPVFQKKNILFGQHMAQKALRFWDMEESVPRAVVIVEGYMDAIALWQVGVREAVASMGTALTVEQVTSAAILAGSKNGRVVLCLDNDQAGVAATERLCRSGILSTVEESYPVEFRVARLPDGVKDPADYIELNQKRGKLDDHFRAEVLGENSLEWMDWYQRHILDQYNQTVFRGESVTFAGLMDRLGGFLAMVKDDQEKRKRFQDIMDILTATIARESNETDVSETVRLQLEAELKRKISIRRKAMHGAHILASADSGSPRGDITRTLARMAPMTDSESHFPKPRRRENDRTTRKELPPPSGIESSFEGKSAATSTTGRRFRARDLTPKKPALTPHFSGFEFGNDHDKRWLDESELSGGYGASKPRQGDKNGGDKFVYFNSNEYHGGSFITDEALGAGYTHGYVSRDPELLIKGINSMIDLKADQILEAAENDLLRCLLNFPQARASLQRIIDVNRSSGSDDKITWTMSEKSWLFRRLVSNDPDLIAFGHDSLIDFQIFLSSQHDAPSGAISNPKDPLLPGLILRNPEDEIPPLPFLIKGEKSGISMGGQAKDSDGPSMFDTDLKQAIAAQPGEATDSNLKQRGSLDHLFDQVHSGEESCVLKEDKVALRAQEAYYTVLWACSVLKLSTKKHELMEMALRLPDNTDETTDGDRTTAATEKRLDMSLLEATIGQDAYHALRADIQDASQQVQLLSGALKGLSSRLIQKALPVDGWHSRQINNDYEELSARLLQHLSELEKWSIPGSDTLEDDEAYETTLERTQAEWGDLYDDDRMWSSDDIVESPPPPSTTNLVQVGGGNQESIDAFSERMEQDWGWLDEPTLDNSLQSFEAPGPYEFDEEHWGEYLREDRRSSRTGV